MNVVTYQLRWVYWRWCRNGSKSMRLLRFNSMWTLRFLCYPGSSVIKHVYFIALAQCSRFGREEIKGLSLCLSQSIGIVQSLSFRQFSFVGRWLHLGYLIPMGVTPIEQNQCHGQQLCFVCFGVYYIVPSSSVLVTENDKGDLEPFLSAKCCLNKCS